MGNQQCGGGGREGGAKQFSDAATETDALVVSTTLVDDADDDADSESSHHHHQQQQQQQRLRDSTKRKRRSPMTQGGGRRRNNTIGPIKYHAALQPEAFDNKAAGSSSAQWLATPVPLPDEALSDTEHVTRSRVDENVLLTPTGSLSVPTSPRSQNGSSNGADGDGAGDGGDVTRLNSVELSLQEIEALVSEELSGAQRPSASTVKTRLHKIKFLLHRARAEHVELSSKMRELSLRKVVSEYVASHHRRKSAEEQEVAQFIGSTALSASQMESLHPDDSGVALYSESASDHLASAGVVNQQERRRASFPLVPTSEELRAAAAAAGASADGDTKQDDESRAVAATSSSTAAAAAASSSQAHSGAHVAKHVHELLLNTDLAACLSKIDRWEFDIFEVQALVPQHPLLVTMYSLFASLNLFSKFNIKEHVFFAFFNQIESGYLPNPYHNMLHAADVAQNMFVYLQMPSFSNKIASLDVFAGLVAAAVHDFRHPGTNNAFQIATGSEIATLYNDQSVLENYHIAEAFKLLRQEQYNLLANFSRADAKSVREMMIQTVLATDMQQHMGLVADLQASVVSKRAEDTWFDVSHRNDRMMLMKVAMHCADVSNPCKPMPVYARWVELLLEEFWSQGDQERALDLPISPMCDRETANVPKSQVAFIQFFIAPLFKAFNEVVPEITPLLEHLKRNKAHYEEQAQIKQAKQEKEQEKEQPTTEEEETEQQPTEEEEMRQQQPTEEEETQQQQPTEEEEMQQQPTEEEEMQQQPPKEATTEEQEETPAAAVAGRASSSSSSSSDSDDDGPPPLLYDQGGVLVPKRRRSVSGMATPPLVIEHEQ